jgi:hypothetical protein
MLPSLSAWRMLLDLDDLIRSDPDRIRDAVDAAARRRSGSLSSSRGTASSSRGGGGGGGMETLDARAVRLRGFGARLLGRTAPCVWSGWFPAKGASEMPDSGIGNLL